MCGVVGYVGSREAEPILVEGLRRLEYRGYDSAGLATLRGSDLHLRKCSGRIADLVQFLNGKPAPGCHGISHTRWATHGPATDVNAHPHIGGENLVAVVHNGVIENYAEIKTKLKSQGVKFRNIYNRSSPRFPSNCWPITSPCCAAAMSICPGIWPKV